MSSVSDYKQADGASRRSATKRPCDS